MAGARGVEELLYSMFGSAEQIAIIDLLLFIIGYRAALNGQKRLRNHYPVLVGIIYIYWAMTIRIPCKSLLIG